ncbi:MAG: hypothetical protein ACREVY_02045 [Gammaproteobacteria bacterium]
MTPPPQSSPARGEEEERPDNAWNVNFNNGNVNNDDKNNDLHVRAVLGGS